MPHIEAIIFDIDGLMVDTEPISHRAWSQLLQSHGCQLEDEHYQRMVGLRSDESVHILTKAYDLPISAAELVQRRTAIYEALTAEGMPVMPGLTDLLEEISRRKLIWGVATSSPRRHARAVLAQLKAEDACQAVAAGDEVPRAKPSPDIYLLAAERLGISPMRCLALEDSLPGAQSALAAGMRVAAVPNGHTLAADFSAVHATYSSLHEVLNDLDRLLAETG